MNQMHIKANHSRNLIYLLTTFNLIHLEEINNINIQYQTKNRNTKINERKTYLQQNVTQFTKIENQNIIYLIYLSSMFCQDSNTCLDCYQHLQSLNKYYTFNDLVLYQFNKCTYSMCQEPFCEPGSNQAILEVTLTQYTDPPIVRCPCPQRGDCVTAFEITNPHNVILACSLVLWFYILVFTSFIFVLFVKQCIVQGSTNQF
ncbi:hypothetical protein pb186bvf_003146 [Paramecium bursaria]